MNSSWLVGLIRIMAAFLQMYLLLQIYDLLINQPDNFLFQ